MRAVDEGNLYDLEVEAYLAGDKEMRDVLGLEHEYVAQLRARTQFFIDGRHYERALMMLGFIEQLDRRDVTASLVTAEVLLELGRGVEARAKVAAVLQANPLDLDARVVLARVHLAAGRLEEAAAELEAVHRADPNATTGAARRARAVTALACAQLGG